MPEEEYGEGLGAPIEHAGPALPVEPAEPAGLAELGWSDLGGESAEEGGLGEAVPGMELGTEIRAELPVYVSFREAKTHRKKFEVPKFFLIDQHGRETLAVTGIHNGEN